MMRHYPVALTEDDNGTFLATCPDLPEAAGVGETEAEALQSVREVIELAIADRLENFERVPARPRPLRGGTTGDLVASFIRSGQGGGG